MGQRGEERRDVNGYVKKSVGQNASGGAKRTKMKKREGFCRGKCTQKYIRWSREKEQEKEKEEEEEEEEEEEDCSD